jgi:dTDP-4-amino-4,6-dideoxy-D-galactose acyltransferase
MSTARVEPLAWDSDFFGLPIARIHAAQPDRRALEGALEACRERGVRCAYLLLDAADARGSEAAQALGFVLRDVRVELDRPLPPADVIAAEASTTLAAVGRERLPALEALVRERFTNSRFFADPGFARERCRELYVAFLQRGLDGGAQRTVLAPADDAGCIVCHADPQDGVGTIELVASRRPGVGTALVRAAVAGFAQAGMSSALVVTQASNVAAQRSYQRAGFRTARSGLWFHRWFDDGARRQE